MIRKVAATCGGDHDQYESADMIIGPDHTCTWTHPGVNTFWNGLCICVGTKEQIQTMV
jgi:hypothetical protein